VKPGFGPVPTALAVLVALVFVPATASEPAGIPWTDSPDQAFASAASSARPVLVDVWAVWCAPCALMERTTWAAPAVVAAAEGFVPLKVDADAADLFVDRYRAEVLPTLLVLDDRGEVLARLTGATDASTLLATMERVTDGYAGYVARRDDTGPEAAAAVASYLLDLDNGARAAELLRRRRKAADGPEPGLDLLAARAELSDERPGAAVKLLEPLTVTSVAADVRGPALELLVRAQRARGRDRAAGEALSRLRDEFPALAAELDDAGDD